jgi:UDP-N-acetylmuramoylalanine--D-glutamate ligase
VTAWDDNEANRAAFRLDDGAPITLRDPTQTMVEFDALVLSPGIPHRGSSAHPAATAAIAAGVPVWSDAELLFQAVRAAGSRARFIGVTGTNGKSTTTALIAHILATAGKAVEAGGNLGPAALALSLLDHNGLYILEMSSYMLERIGSLRFDTAIMLNISPDHLERHGDMAGYVAAKRSIFDRRDFAVIGTDDSLSRDMADDIGAITISGNHAADVWYEDGMLRDASGPILAMADAPALPGNHNAQNAAAAAATALHLGIDRATLAAGIRSFPGLPHRQELVATVDGVPYVNDSKGTNADASAHALVCYNRIIWIAGGVSKEGGIASLAPYFPRIAHALLIGRDAPMLAAQLGGVPHSIVGTLDQAVPAARAAAAELNADVVLLSPACASFDQFSGYPARGDRFAELARALEGAV